MSANDRQVGGNHYSKHGKLQHWDVVHHFDLDYFQGVITKYLFRWKDKDGVKDLEKAMHFLEKYIELQKKTSHETKSEVTRTHEARQFAPDIEPGDRSGM